MQHSSVFRVFISLVAASMLAAAFVACGDDSAGSPAPATRTLRFDFDEGEQGWEAVFADYPPANAEIYELEAGLRPLPETVASDKRGYMLRGSNRSDDLWMSLVRRLTVEDGLSPDTRYRVHFAFSFASDAPAGCVGIGGAPGESVYVKVGASPKPAGVTADEEGFLHFDLDNGAQSQTGSESTAAGDVTNGTDCEGDNLGVFRRVEREVEHAHIVTSNDAGELTVFIGTDSGYEGVTELFYESIVLTLTPED